MVVGIINNKFKFPAKIEMAFSQILAIDDWIKNQVICINSEKKKIIKFSQKGLARFHKFKILKI